MNRTFRLLSTFLLSTGAATVEPASRLMAVPAPEYAAGQSAQHATLRAAAANAPNLPFKAYESQTEEQLLAFANESRQKAGLPALRLDFGLSEAARIHAQAMLEARRLSHQLDGEPSLPQRVAATTHLQLDQEGENVALDYDAEHAHEHLMLSPPHRANLLNPAYNVVGLGVVRSGDLMYIVQDFGHALPNYSSAEMKDHIAASVNEARRRAGQADLLRRDSRVSDDAACSMAQSGTLRTSPVDKLAERLTVIRFTTLSPKILPNGAAGAIAAQNLHSFSVGACYGRTVAYPTGVYWIVVSLQ